MNKVRVGISVSSLAALGTAFGSWKLSQDPLATESKSSLQGSTTSQQGTRRSGIHVIKPLSSVKVAQCVGQSDQSINSSNKYIHVNKIYLDSPPRGENSFSCNQGNNDPHPTGSHSTNDCARVTPASRLSTNARVTPASRLSTNAKIAKAISTSRTLIQRIMIEQGIPGAQVAVSNNGRLIWSEGIGLSDVENNVPCSRDSVMRIASISKPLTAVALLQLWQKGLVDLDAPIQTYVPLFPCKTYAGKKVVITTRQLLSHLGGIRHYDKEAATTKENKNEKTKKNEFKSEEYYITDHYESVEDALKLFANDELLSEPGKEYNYTTHGWTLVSAVLERVSGETFLGYMQRNVFGPLGMKSTNGEYHCPLVYNRSRHYSRTNDGKLENVPYVDLSYKWAGGGLISNAEDLVKFGNAVLASYTQSLKPSSAHDVQRTEDRSLRLPSSDSGSLIKETQLSDASNSRSSSFEELQQANTQSDTAPSKGRQTMGTSKARCTKTINTHRSSYILHPDTTQLMLKKAVDSVNRNRNSYGVGYALGWFVNKGGDEVVCGEGRPFYFGHTGAAIGATSVLMVIPTPGTSRDCPADQCEGWSCEGCGCDVCGEGTCGVVVCVIFNLQEVKGVFTLGTDIAKEFSLCF